MKKNIIKGIFICALTIIILLMLDRILVLKSEDGISQLKSFYKQKEDTVDALFVGSSHVYCDISTGVLWDQKGIAAYDLGGAEAPAWTSYYHLKEALKTQHPDVVFYELSIAGIRPTLYPPEFWVEDNNYGMKWNSNRIDMLKENTLEKTFPKLLFPLGPMHGRYTDLSENDFTDVKNTINYKGFDPREYVVEYERPDDVTKVTGRTPCSEKAEEYLRKIIALTKEENVELVLFVVPYVVQPEEQEIYNYMFDIGKEEGITCIDFNTMYDEIGIDFATDMADELHLNFSGNYKFSSFMADMLADDYGIPDRRGDSNYDSWNVDALNQRVERDALTLTNTEDSGEFLEVSSHEGFVSFVYLADDGNAADDAKTTENLKNLGISLENIQPGMGYIVKNGRIIDCGSDSFRMHCKEGNDNFLFMMTADDDEHSGTLYYNESANSFGESNIIYTYDAVNHVFVGSRNF